MVVETPDEYSVDPPAIGDSVSVNGCCLTVVDAGTTLRFDVSPETLARTALGGLRIGASVNLERAMRVGDRFGGHIVQGHVEATGECLSIREDGPSAEFRFQAPSEFDRYLIDKGSVTVDGISLTVVQPIDGAFSVWIVPHTRATTNLREMREADLVNLEFDVIAKYVEKLVASQ